MSDFEGWFDKNLERIKTNMTACEELTGIFTGTATYLTRRDQAARLRSLKLKVIADVKFLLDAESSAKSGFTEGKLLSAPLSFVAGGFIGMLLHHHDPLATALKAAGSTFGRNPPFGMVLIAVGKGGLPDDVKVIPLSRLARESKTSESEVRATIVSKGYLLITPQLFTATMDGIEHLVLDGALPLPLPLNEFQKRIPPVIPGRFLPVLDE